MCQLFFSAATFYDRNYKLESRAFWPTNRNVSQGSQADEQFLAVVRENKRLRHDQKAHEIRPRGLLVPCLSGSE